MTRSRGEAGVTLIEVMVTITIMGVAFTALLAALMGIFNFGGQHRELAVSETLVRRYADAVDTATYVNCAAAADYAGALTGAPPEYLVTITSIEYWNGDQSATFGTSKPACETATDQGVQRITVQVAQAAGGVEKELVVLKRNPA